MNLKRTWLIIKQTFDEIFANRIFKLSAALAYYTIFSIPGLIIVIIWVSDFFYGHDAIEGSLYNQITGLVGSDAAKQIQETIKNATLFPNKGLSTAIGIGTLLFAATSVFAEIQDSINMIWRLKTKPKKGRGFLKLVIDRLLSFSIVISLGFLLLVSLIANGILDVLNNHITDILPESQVYLAYISNMSLTFIITTLLFGLIFKILPDAKIKWKAVLIGSLVTALLFLLGKYFIGFYMGQNRMSTAYGAAGSIIVILLWVYYSAIILYVGAIYTRVYAIHHNMHIYPSQYAVWVEQVEVEIKDSIQAMHHDPIVAAAEAQAKEEEET